MNSFDRSFMDAIFAFLLLAILEREIKILAKLRIAISTGREYQNGLQEMIRFVCWTDFSSSLSVTLNNNLSILLLSSKHIDSIYLLHQSNKIHSLTLKLTK